MKQPRIETYLEILEKRSGKNSLYSRTVGNCLTKITAPEDQMYLVVWAPALLEYVAWVIDQAVRDKKERLYFLSRDAYPMYLLARRLVEILDLKLDCRYLRVSRYSLRIPEYHLMGEKCLDRIFLSGIDVSLYQIMRRANLSEEEMSRVCKEIGYIDDIYRILNRREILDLREKVRMAGHQGKTEFYDAVCARSREAYADALGYLTQEGLTEDVSWALVDSGWVGTIQLSIRTLLATQKPGIRVDGYYFGLYEYPKEAEGCSYKSYYFKPRGQVFKKAGFSNCLYEIIYSEPHAMVERYRQEGDRYVPVCTGQMNPNSIELERYGELLQIFADTLADVLIKEIKTAEGGSRCVIRKLLLAKSMTEKLYTKLMSTPNEWEAAYYGGFLFSDDLRDEQMKTAANKLSQQEIKDLRAISKLKIMLRLSHKVIHESAWIEGSIVNAKGQVSKHLRAAKRAKYLTHLRQSLKACVR